MGNPRKPTALKLLEGTAQPCRAVEEAEWPMVDGYPEDPDDDPEATEQFAAQWQRATFMKIHDGDAS